MCTGDAMRLCGHEVPNVQRITACMVKQRANLSPGCRAVMDREHAAGGEPPPPSGPAASLEGECRTASAG
jgi:hypothetical protein